MPVFSDGQKISAALAWDRLIESIPASYVVWKDGSTYRAECLLKGGTDYSGTGAATVIQSALNALTSGGTVFLKRATYELTTNIHPTAENQKLIMEKGVVLKPATGFTTSLSQDYLIYSNKDGFAVIGGELNCDYPNFTGVGGIWLNADNNQALYVEAHHSDSDGGTIDTGITGPHGCLVFGCYVHDVHNREGGIHATSFGGRAIANFIEGDLNDSGGTSNTKTEAGLKIGDEGAFAAYNVIKDFENCPGIYIYPNVHGTDYNSSATIIGNLIHNCKNGIKMNSGDQPVRIIGNIIRQITSTEDGWGRGIQITTAKAVTISCNHFENCYSAAIWVADGVDNVLIQGNEILDITLHGIDAKGVIKAVGNIIDTVTTNHGITLRDTADGSILTANEIRNVNGNDIYIASGCVGARLQDNMITGTIADNGTRTRINGMGQAAYGVGGTPTAADWDIGDIVRNTDDDTIWVKDHTGTMRQLA